MNDSISFNSYVTFYLIIYIIHYSPLLITQKLYSQNSVERETYRRIPEEWESEGRFARGIERESPTKNGSAGPLTG